MVSLQEWKMFYLITICLIFTFAMVLQIPKLKIDANTKLIVFLIWAAYGVVPTFHWTYNMGGLENPVVQVSPIASLLLLVILYKHRKNDLCGDQVYVYSSISL
jgi:hypothetical protein